MKSLIQAKSRLHVPADFRSPHPTSAEFATAFLADVIRSTSAAESVSRVLLTSADLALARFAQLHGVDFIAEPPELTRADGPWSNLNFAASAAVDVAFEDDGCSYAAIVPGDLAALRRETVDTILRRTIELGTSTFVRDHTGTGTTLLCVAREHHIEPAFGGLSGAAHAQAGAIDITDSAPPDARLDVDTWADLSTASSLGLGAHCLQLLGQGS